jgi:hypothetical protein
VVLRGEAHIVNLMGRRAPPACLLLSVLLAGSSGAAVAAPRIAKSAFARPAHARAGEPVLLVGDRLTPPVEVWFSDGTGPVVPAGPTVVDPRRGWILTRVPPGAATGEMKVTAAGDDSLPYHFRVDAGLFSPGTGAVTGRVSDGNTPVAGAVLLLLGAPACGDPDLHDFTTSDAGGVYTLHGPPGDAVVLAFPPLGAGELAPAGAAASLSDTPAIVDVAFLPGSAVTGRVVDAADPNAGVGGARVGFDLQGPGRAHEEAIADPNGRFAAALGPGTWRMEIDPPPGDLHAAFVDAGVEVGGASLDLGAIGLGSGVRIQGTLTRGADGAPLAGAEVTARPASPCCQDADRKTTAGDGAFTLVVDPNRTYRVAAAFDDRSGIADAEAPDTAVADADVAVDLEAEDAAFIEGAAADPNGAPIACLRIEAELFVPGPGPGAFARTRPDGTYRLRVEPDPSGYRVSTSEIEGGGPGPAYASKTWNGTPAGAWFPCEGAAVPAPAAGAATAGIDFALPRAAAIQGVISTEAGTCSDDHGGRLPPLVVDDGQDHPCSLGRLDPDHPGPGYRVELLPPSPPAAPLRVCVYDADFEPQCFTGRTPPVYDPVVVGAGQTGQVDLCLKPCSTLWYRDADEDGYGDPDVTVQGCGPPPGYLAHSLDCDDADPATSPAAVEACDGADDDCDGVADEFETVCGTGACASAGYCSAGVDDCVPGIPSSEVCDGIDNDCDGTRDDGDPGGGAPCGTGLPGACGAGTTVCRLGSLRCQQTVQPSVEVCDGIDNDCDGSTDGVPTTCGVGACASTGGCAGGVSTCVPGEPAPDDATCDGSDDDCDGSVDEDHVPVPTACGVGACASTGAAACAGGTLQDTCAPGPPAAEACDGIDNDCDGSVPAAEGDPDGDGVLLCAPDNCPGVYNPSQADSDGDAEGGDACDLSVTFPLLAADVACGGPPPTIEWSPETYDRYRVLVGWDPSFEGRRKVTSGDRLLRSTSWTIPPRKWARACAKAAPNLHFKVFGRSTITRQAEFSETVTIRVK